MNEIQDIYLQAAAATATAATATDPVLWLSDLIDQWEKAMSEEGCNYEAPPVPAAVR